MFDKCDFTISITDPSQSPNTLGLSEFVFCGRSNVGKSSIINAIMRRKALARTSSKPGKTITLNYYKCDDSLYLVDVPGYGYASRGQDQRLGFGTSIEKYLYNNDNLKQAFLLIDTVVGPTNDDMLMYNYLLHLGLDITILSTKCDKIGTTLRARAIKNIKEKMQNDNVIMTSSEKNIGISDIQNLIYSLK